MCMHLAKIGGAIILLSISYMTWATPGEGIVLDPISGNYVISYFGSGRTEYQPLRKVVFVPATKISARIKSSFKLEKANLVAYRYTLSNGAQSKQPLESIIIDPVADILSKVDLPKKHQDVDLSKIALIDQLGASSIWTPAGWVGRTTTSRKGGLIIGWDYEELVSEQDGLQAGVSQGGFGFVGLHLPGIGVAQVRGNSGITEWPDEGPRGEVGEQFDKVVQNDFAPHIVSVPTIAIPAPYDAALLLDRIRTEMQAWPGKQLLDAAYSAKLDSYLSSAANAFRLNQPKVAREQIEAVRKLLAKEHHYVDHDDEDDEDTDEHKRATRFTIDRLAARVLDFDLRYVLKRTERDHEDHEQKKH